MLTNDDNQEQIPPEVSAYMAAIGRRGGKLGGKSTSKQKQAAARKNQRIAAERRRELAKERREQSNAA